MCWQRAGSGRGRSSQQSLNQRVPTPRPDNPPQSAAGSTETAAADPCVVCVLWVVDEHAYGRRHTLHAGRRAMCLTPMDQARERGHPNTPTYLKHAPTSRPRRCLYIPRDPSEALDRPVVAWWVYKMGQGHGHNKLQRPRGRRHRIIRQAGRWLQPPIKQAGNNPESSPARRPSMEGPIGSSRCMAAAAVCGLVYV